MKALFIVTGRGLGGDSMIALNTIRAFEKRGIQCEVALDSSASWTLFKKTDTIGIEYQSLMPGACPQQNHQPFWRQQNR